MSESDRINEALRLENLQLATTPRVVGLQWEYYEDHMGEEALKILVVLDDSTTDRDIEKGDIQGIKWPIIESLRQHGVELFAYFWFAKESELAEEPDG